MDETPQRLRQRTDVVRRDEQVRLAVDHELGMPVILVARTGSSLLSASMSTAGAPPTGWGGRKSRLRVEPGKIVLSLGPAGLDRGLQTLRRDLSSKFLAQGAGAHDPEPHTPGVRAEPGDGLDERGRGLLRH